MKATCGLCEGRGWHWERTTSPDWLDEGSKFDQVFGPWWTDAPCSRCDGRGFVPFGRGA